jgi:hypothetical protein
MNLIYGKRQIALLNYEAPLHTVFFLLLLDVFLWLAALVSLDFFLAEVQRSRSDTPHSMGHLWTSVRPDAETYM